MDNNDHHLNPQSTRGLKLMTVFIAVLALHVVVIGGFTIYHLMSGGGSDADLAMDKNHKGFKTLPDGSVVTDGTLPEVVPTDKSATAMPGDSAIPANPTTPVPDQTATTETSPISPMAPTLAPAPALAAPTLSPTPLSTPTSSAATLAPPPESATSIAPPAANATTTTTPSIAPTPAASSTVSPTSAPTPAPSELTTTPRTVAPTPAPSVPISTPTATPAPFVGPVKMPAGDATATLAAPAPQLYVVKITDSYKKIARAHHVTVAQLKEANNIRNNVLHTGQRLVIPSGKTTLATTGADTSFNSTSTGPMLTSTSSAPTAMLAASPAGATSSVKPHHHFYTVMKGDTLARIARKFKTTPSALMEANDITNPTKLTIGKRLRIPARETRSARNSEPGETHPSQAKANGTTAQLANYVH